MTEKLHYLLSQNSENELLEFKEAKNQYDFNKLGEYFSALSNEANLKNVESAWLLFGVKDDKSIVGTNFRNDTSKLHSLKAEIANHTTNRITFKEIYEVKTPQGRVVLFEIPPAPSGIPIAWKGHYFGRDGEELNALNLEEIERIRKQGVQKDWSGEICKGAIVDDLSLEAIDFAKNEYKTKHPNLVNEVDSWSIEQFLSKAKLLKSGQITNAAMLLLGRDEKSYLLEGVAPQITWILKDGDNIEQSYEHFGLPFLLSAKAVHDRIRNFKYRYMSDNKLFPEEVDKYDNWVLYEAIHNSIAHQDYELKGRINVVEFPDKLVISNVGDFLAGKIEDVIERDSPLENYRNDFLCRAMVEINMIDTIGSGIKRMFSIQKRRFFPMPDYKLEKGRVQVTIYGKILNERYTKLLASKPEISLVDVIGLDRIAKNYSIEEDSLKDLRAKGLVEGRKPNLHISASVAQITDQKSDYIKMRGIDDSYIQKMITEYLTKFEVAKKADFEKILLDKLPEFLDEKQKKDKIKNNLQSLKRSGILENEGKTWKMSKR